MSFSSIYIPQYEHMWYGISPLVKPPCLGHPKLEHVLNDAKIKGYILDD